MMEFLINRGADVNALAYDPEFPFVDPPARTTPLHVSDFG
jgi:hypothetical protein